MLCGVVTCYQEILSGVQCCCTWHCVVEVCTAVLYVVMCVACCAVLVDVTKSYYMSSSVVPCNLELLHAVQCC